MEASWASALLAYADYRGARLDSVRVYRLCHGLWHVAVTAQGASMVAVSSDPMHCLVSILEQGIKS